MRKYILKHPFLLIWAIIATNLSDLLWLNNAFRLKNIVDLASAGDMDRLVPELIKTTILLLLIAYTIYLGHSSRAIYLKKTMVAVKKDLFGNLMDMDMDAFQSGNSGRYLSVFNNDVKLFDQNYAYTLIRTISDLILLPCAAGAMLYLNPGIALLVLVLSLVSLVVPVLFGKVLAKRQKDTVEAQEKYNIRLKDIFTGYEMIQSYGIAGKMKQSHGELVEEVEQKQKRLRFMTGWASCCSYGTGRMNYILVIAIAAVLVAKGRMTPGALLAALELMGSVLGPIWSLSDQLATLKGMKEVNKRIETLITPSDKQSVQKPPAPPVVDEIKIHDLSFAYEAEGEAVLKNINLTFEKGKKYAVVGASGCGKTTLLKLLMGYYDSYDGEILLNGADLKNIEKTSYYQQVSMIHQNIFLFDDTVRNNITLYADYREQAVLQAVQDAGLYEKLSAVSGGLDSQVEEGGRNFSGGERQRLAIARAFLRGTPVLILDEATTGLDGKVAAQIDQLLFKKEDLTAVVVTHKLTEAFLARCDEIIVVKNGAVVEKGRFDDLLAKAGEFYSLYKIAN